MRETSKKPNLECEITLYKSEVRSDRPAIRITAERFSIVKNNQVISHYRIYCNEKLFKFTSNLDALPFLLKEARKYAKFERKSDSEVYNRIRSTRRIKYSAAETI